MMPTGNLQRMTPARYIMVGGFLGAGKTTAILRLAERLTASGRRVGLITNDQSVGLVDTTMLAAHGFPVEEITGGCFCCRFNSLVDAAERLAAGRAPGRVHRRAGRQLHGPAGHGELPAAPDVRRRLRHRPAQRRWSTRCARCASSASSRADRSRRRSLYIYGKQLEEAELIVINKIDLLDAGAHRSPARGADSREYPAGADLRGVGARRARASTTGSTASLTRDASRRRGDGRGLRRPMPKARRCSAG